MKIKKFVINPFQMNCYVYYDENTSEGIIIDPAAYNEYEKNYILKFVNINKINIKYIINTHGHVDHVLGNKFAVDNFKCPLLIHREDLLLLQNAENQGLLFGINIESIPAPDEYIEENSEIKLNNNEINFIHTPGHSPGGVCIIDHNNKNIFCGDTIFSETIGRTDLPGGNMQILLDSIINKLFSRCKDDYILYPGHMEETSIGKEKKYNPFLK